MEPRDHLDGDDPHREQPAGWLNDDPARFDPPPSWVTLEPPDVAWGSGWRVWSIESTGSTNADLLAAADAGAPDRAVLVTGHQTAGRGRLDRRWDAPPGANLLMSILFCGVPDRPGELTRRVGVAAAGAATAVAGVNARLKWPNDVLVGGRKLAGILAQQAGDGVVVGLGLNVGWAPDGAAMLGAGHQPAEVLAAVLAAYDALPDDVAAFDARYRALLSTLGSVVRVELSSGLIEGRAIDLADDGALMVLDDCAITHRIDAGDVIHVRS